MKRLDLANSRPIHRAMLIFFGWLIGFSLMLPLLSQFLWVTWIQYTPAGAGFGAIDCSGLVLGYRFLPSNNFSNAGSFGRYNDPLNAPPDRRPFLMGVDYWRTKYNVRRIISLPGMAYWYQEGTSTNPPRHVALINHLWVISIAFAAYFTTRWYIARKIHILSTMNSQGSS